MTRDVPQPPDRAHRIEAPDDGTIVLKEFRNAVHRGATDEKPPLVLDAFVDGSALAVIYESPYRDGRFGLRRSWPPHARDDDVASNGVGIYEEISEPPAMSSDRLRLDASGVQWWGDLDEQLPLQQQPLDN